MFIKVHIEELRRLIEECGLTRAELGELLLLALYMDGDNKCYPSQRKVAEQTGKSKSGVARIHRTLRAKGALEYVSGIGRRSSRYVLPACFEFGAGSGKNKSESVTNVTHRVLKNAHSECAKSDTQTPSNVTLRVLKNAHSHESGFTSAPSEEKGAKKRRNKNHITRSDQEPETAQNKIQGGACAPEPISPALEVSIGVAGLLHAAGVRPREALLLAQQYPEHLLREVLADAKAKQPADAGAWIRRVVELRAARTIRYPDDGSELAQEIERTAAALVAAKKETDKIDPYLRGEYWSVEKTTDSADIAVISRNVLELQGEEL